MLVLGGGLYGIAMGSFALVAGYRTLGEQWPQMLCSAVKVPLLLLLATLIGLPSFFVFNTLAGLREDFSVVVAALVRSQAAMALVLLALAPLTLFVYASLPPNTDEYGFAVMFNAVVFAVASIAVQIHISQSYIPLIKKNPRHRIMKRGWLFIYAFVGIQLGWNLRPFIGSPTMPFSFLREGGWENAYVHVGRMAWEVVRALTE